MTTLTEPQVHASEQMHYYHRTGAPCYEVVAKNGSMRPTTLRDARLMNLVPSVTSIIRCAAAPGLELWKQQQVLHAALTLPLIPGETEDAYLAHIVGTANAVTDWAGEGLDWDTERTFAHPLGYGGKVDISTSGFIADFKTTEKDLEGIKTWDEHALQLAAYRHGIGAPSARCAIVYVNVLKPGEAKVIEIPEEELQRGWNMFRALRDFWYARTGLGEVK